MISFLGQMLRWIAVIVIGIAAIVPLTLLASVLAALFGVLSGVYRGISNYIHALTSNLHLIRVPHEQEEEPAYQCFLMGAVYRQLCAAAADSWEKNKDSVRLFHELYEVICTGLLKGNAYTAYPKKMAGAFFIGAAASVLYVISVTVIAIVTGLLFAVFGCMTAGYAALCGAMWLMDHSYLMLHKIRSECSSCKNQFLIPQFLCPHCHRYMHKQLVPGKYGIWHHRCLCGKRIPCTFFGGRSSLEAFCPVCSSSLISSEARQIVFQLIGETASGKSVFLSAFYHVFLEKLQKSGLSVTIPDGYQGQFDELAYWYQGNPCPATTETDARSYPVLIDGIEGRTKRQFSVYDIAGEMFDGYTAENVKIIQKQFKYCSGLLFVLDPFCEGKLRAARKFAGKSLSDFSSAPITDTATNFFNYMVDSGMLRIDQAWDKPVCVLIAKADVEEIYEEIGPHCITQFYQSHTDVYQDLQQARDALCRRFLSKNGFDNFLKKMDTKFTELHFFPVSAMGHMSNGTVYEPWGVMDAVNYILPKIDDELYTAINP